MRPGLLGKNSVPSADGSILILHSAGGGLTGWGAVLGSMKLLKLYEIP